ncbi:MAG: site-specific integrase [Prevotella sp.]|nr:site-specific integrase [Prevotella sp.]
MDKKKFFFNAVSCSLNGKTWTTPVYHKGRENYVDFSSYDPATGGMHRKKIMLDHIKSTRTRSSYAHSLIEELTQRLMRGWNPWVEARAGTQFLTWDEVCELYKKYVIKLHNDNAFRDETVRDYLSRLKVLSEWKGMRTYKVFYPYQIDETVLSKFMDYILMERNNSVQTYNNYVAWLRTFFAWMMARRYVHDDPTVGLQTIRRPKNKNRTVIPDKVLVEIRRYLEERNKHYLLACYILHYMFVRPAEMATLRLQDFQIAKKTLILHGDQTKNRQDAVVTLPDHIVKLMIELSVFDYPGNYYLFSDKFSPGETWKDSKQFRDFWNYHLRRDLNLPAQYKFYSLKDTGITNMLRANTDPISVRDQARHSSLLITNTYTPLDIKEANPLILSYQGVF